MAKFSGAMVLTILMFFPYASFAQTSWKVAIDTVSQKSAIYYNYAMKLGSGNPGSMLQGIGYDRHVCAIVGRMLGFETEVQQAEVFAYPALETDADPMELMEFSFFLDAWVAAAENSVAMTEMQRKNLWNLECVGKHGVPQSARISEEGLQGDFLIKENKLVVYGDIETGFYERFLEVLEKNPSVNTVALGSAGGSVVDAILSGLTIRDRGLSTTLHGPCFSACPLIFVGGKERLVWMGAGPHLGFHRVSSPSGEVALDHNIYWQIGQYLDAMGVNSELVLSWMASASSSELFEPNFDRLCEARVATWVQRVCG